MYDEVVYDLDAMWMALMVTLAMMAMGILALVYIKTYM